VSAPSPSVGMLEMPDDLGDFQDEMLRRNLGDGLPLIPPTPERVSAMLTATRRAPDEVVAELPPARGLATVEAVAANAVMAGCVPTHLPVVLAAVEAVADEAFNLYGIQDTTNPVTPLVIVNGPVRHAIGMNLGINTFGPGNRPNAVIGRALRLVLHNIGGGHPGTLDRATQGQPAKYTFCAPEHEERNPWEPFHVEHGYDPASSAVTVFGVHGFHNIIDLTASSAEELLDMLAAGMAAVGTNNLTHGGETLLALAPEHAERLASDGFSKDAVRRYLFERARIDITRLPAAFQELMRTRRPRWFDQRRLPITDAAAEINLVVAGGTGIHSAFLPMFGSTVAVSRPVAPPPTTEGA
jgi:hypothetical protein